MTYPEVNLLAILVGDSAARKVSVAPGGWRSLSEAELDVLRLRPKAREAVLALQRLTARDYPKLPVGQLADPDTVVGVYGPRMAGLEHEVVIAIALDGKNRLLAEFEVARGGKHGAALTPSDVLRPVIRVGASAMLLLHNHPSGDPTPSSEDLTLTRALRQAGGVVGIPLLDHIIVAARFGGHVSLLQRGVLE